MSAAVGKQSTEQQQCVAVSDVIFNGDSIHCSRTRNLNSVGIKAAVMRPHHHLSDSRDRYIQIFKWLLLPASPLIFFLLLFQYFFSIFSFFSSYRFAFIAPRFNNDRSPIAFEMVESGCNQSPSHLSYIRSYFINVMLYEPIVDFSIPLNFYICISKNRKKKRKM